MPKDTPEQKREIILKSAKARLESNGEGSLLTVQAGDLVAALEAAPAKSGPTAPKS